MALLLLWEVEHGCPFPSLAGDSQASRLTGFTRRLKDRVARDDELKEWLVCKYMQMPLAPGLPASHHSRWSVKVVAPPDGLEAGWYNTFVERWKGYLQSLSGHRQGPEGTSTSATEAGGVRRGRAEEPDHQTKRRRAAPVTRMTATTEASSAPIPRMESAMPEGQQASPNAEGYANASRKRAASLAGWLIPRPTKKGTHGRASEGPPT
jgi:hypothetical protein